MVKENKSLEWSSLDIQLCPWIQEAIKSMGYPTMTPVQASTIPLFGANKDVVVEAVTGSGKTLAFVIPVLHKISRLLHGYEGEKGIEVKRGHMLSVVLAPTRELANQIKSVFDKVTQYIPEDLPSIRTQLLIGSISTVREDIEQFLDVRPQILIGTPGRMLEFLSCSSIKSGSLEIVVLDEADKLLDVSFEKEVTKILKILPRQRRTGLFSATISAAGNSIFRTGMTNAVQVVVKTNARSAAPTSLNISYMPVKSEKKLSTLIELLKDYNFEKCIVYFPTCLSVKYFYLLFRHVLQESEIKYFSLHGQLQAKPRLRALDSFSEENMSNSKYVLMTTDVAARGIDVPNVDLVISLDPPTDPEVFLHRCGRTARANKVGHAIVMLQEGSRELDYVDFMDVKGILMNEATPPDVSKIHQKLLNRVKKFILDDRANHEVAVKSYVSFVKYYSKHAASSIFRKQNLDYIGLAKMYGLLRLPKMPEAAYIPDEIMPTNGWIDEEINFDTYAYADKQKEKARLENLDLSKKKNVEDSKRRKVLKDKNEAWSGKKDKKETKQVRKEKLKRKREAVEKQIMEESSEDETETDWKDLVKQNKKKKKNDMQGSFLDL